MVNTLHHRGPDDRGVWIDGEVGLALGHARLSIIDISACGHQPMTSRDGRHVMVFNGEIYNFKEIRARLHRSGRQFRGDSDTEVLLEAIAEWGIEGALREAVGMFAFAIWDRRERILMLARDRMGEKPLYYGLLGSTFVFASELKALRVHPAWRGQIDRDALTLFLRHGYVPGPRTIYTKVRKLQPGCLLRIPYSCVTAAAEGEPESYWSLEEAIGGTKHQFSGSDNEAVDGLERLLHDAVGKQMVADVPLGAFLSGGVDSSTVVALMQAQSTRPVRTFTIGFDQASHDEAPAAQRIAAHLGTDHTELYVRPEDALAVVPQLGTVYDEPFADSSQIPTLLVSALARRSVTVSLSGDGGDELFGGYPTYLRGPHLHERLKLVPPSLRHPISQLLLTRTARAVAGSINTRNSGGLIAERAVRLAEMLEHTSPLAIHRGLQTQWVEPATIVRGGTEPLTLFTSSRVPWPTRSFAEGMLLTDASVYLPDDLLVKIDRAAMSVSLETRVPLLDHRIVEFAMRLPWEMKVRGGVGKWILRQVLYRYVPQALVEGPKKGFAVPLAGWLRGPLREWAGDLLSRDRIIAEGLFRHEPIAAKWIEHQTGKCDWSLALWAVLMFQVWYQEQSA